MKAAAFFLLFVLALPAQAGLFTQFQRPPEFAHLRLERARSNHLVVDKIWLTREQGQMVVRGYVTKRLHAPAKISTVLRVQCLDDSGAVLAETEATYNPAALRHRFRRPASTRYHAHIELIPAGTTSLRLLPDDSPGPRHPLSLSEPRSVPLAPDHDHPALRLGLRRPGPFPLYRFAAGSDLTRFSPG
jgi:hypothetical protein